MCRLHLTSQWVTCMVCILIASLWVDWCVYVVCTWQGSGHTDLDYNYVKVVPGKAMAILIWIIIM